MIANRGEIAIRIIQAARERSLATLAIHPFDDASSLHVNFADEAILLEGTGTAAYLDVEQVIRVARDNVCDAIHPGYGFLAEDPYFSEVCEANNIKFIGASAENIKRMGNKSEAKETVKKYNVPVIPGSDGPVDDIKKLEKRAEKLGIDFAVDQVGFQTREVSRLISFWQSGSVRLYAFNMIVGVVTILMFVVFL